MSCVHQREKQPGGCFKSRFIPMCRILAAFMFSHCFASRDKTLVTCSFCQNFHNKPCHCQTLLHSSDSCCSLFGSKEKVHLSSNYYNIIKYKLDCLVYNLPCHDPVLKLIITKDNYLNIIRSKPDCLVYYLPCHDMINSKTMLKI